MFWKYCDYNKCWECGGKLRPGSFLIYFSCTSLFMAFTKEILGKMKQFTSQVSCLDLIQLDCNGFGNNKWCTLAKYSFMHRQCRVKKNSAQGERRKKKKNLPKKVAYISCSDGHTHFTQTKTLMPISMRIMAGFRQA
jgi:hypothetical protein